MRLEAHRPASAPNTSGEGDAARRPRGRFNASLPTLFLAMKITLSLFVHSFWAKRDSPNWSAIQCAR
jgi:hypothetical protein